MNELEKLLSDGMSIKVTEQDGLEELQDICVKAFEDACKERGLPPELKATENEEGNPQETDDIAIKRAQNGEGFDARGKIASAWQRAIGTPTEPTPLGSEFAKCKTLKDKKEMKSRWAKETYKNCDVSKSFETGYTESDGIEVQWHTLGCLVDSYGGWGWPPAVKGAQLHALKASRLGKSWFYHDGMSNLLHIKKEKFTGSKKMEKCWSQLTKFFTEYRPDENENKNDAATPAVAEDAGAASAEEASKVAEAKAAAAAKAAAKAKAVAKGKAGGKPPKGTKPPKNGADDPPAGGSDPKDKLVQRFKEAAKIKGILKRALEDSQGLLGKFADDNSYEWGAHANVQGKLQSKRDDLKSKLKGFGDEFLLQDAGALKKRYYTDFLVRELTNFMTLEGEGTELALLTKNLLAQHNAVKTG